MKAVNDPPDDLEAAALAMRSGAVTTNDLLVGFLYLLMRDKLTPGEVEYLMLQVNKDLLNFARCTGEVPVFSLTNGHLARYAQDIASRLKRVFPGPVLPTRIIIQDVPLSDGKKHRRKK